MDVADKMVAMTVSSIASFPHSSYCPVCLSKLPRDIAYAANKRREKYQRQLTMRLRMKS